MIRLVIVYFERAVYLLCEHNAEELMRECHIAERKQHVCAALEPYSFRPPIGVLAQGILYPGSYPYITYSELPNYQAGQTCARQILHLLDHPDDVQRIVLKPEINK